MRKLLSRLRNILFCSQSGQGPVRMLSFRVLYLCIFLPPVLYIFTVQGLEKYLENSWKQEVGRELIRDREGVMQGKIRVQDEIRKNLEQFVHSRLAAVLGTEIRIMVRTGKGRQLYPAFDLGSNFQSDGNISEDARLTRLQERLLALENARILQEGLIYHVSVKIPGNTWLSNSILLFYIFTFAVILYFSYHSRVRASEMAALEQEKKLEQTRERLEGKKKNLAEAQERQAEFQRQVHELQASLRHADIRMRSTEEEALVELEALEQKLESATRERRARETEIRELTCKLENLESAPRSRDKKQEKEYRLYTRRFQTLYKNLEFTQRAAEGLAQLPEDWKLKAEEMIHNLNFDPGMVRVKRKVFSRGETAVLETEFSHRGRIYWRAGTGNKPEILAIGTKNSQDRDLRYLQNLYGQDSQE